jgi:hypothetical protein
MFFVRLKLSDPSATVYCQKLQFHVGHNRIQFSRVHGHSVPARREDIGNGDSYIQAVIPALLSATTVCLGDLGQPPRSWLTQLLIKPRNRTFEALIQHASGYATPQKLLG